MANDQQYPATTGKARLLGGDVLRLCISEVVQAQSEMLDGEDVGDATPFACT